MKRFPAIACCLLLVACGQTGPLYLPDQAPPKKGLSIRPDTHNPGDESRSTPIPPPAKPAVAPKAPPPAAASVAPPPPPSSSPTP